MRETRVFLDAALASGTVVDLPDAAFRHLVQVLRMQAGDALTVFNGHGGEYAATLETVAKRGASLRIGAYTDVDRESPLALTLVQGISKGDRMDWTVQKAVELGVRCIVPVVTERCNVQIDRDRQDKKLDHWRGIVLSACEQSGRTRVPTLQPVQKLTDWLGTTDDAPRLLLDPEGAQSLPSYEQVGAACSLLVGPEGGFSPNEIALAVRAGCIGLSLGPRVLRTETAGVAALAVLQARFGDWR